MLVIHALIGEMAKHLPQEHQHLAELAQVRVAQVAKTFAKLNPPQPIKFIGFKKEQGRWLSREIDRFPPSANSL
jgi:hypothetical protein